MDPRPAVIGRRLAGVGRILVFASAKGGVGKSVCAAAAALVLAAAGRRTGLLDLDFQGACAHLLLGAPLVFPEEDAGLIPCEAAGVRLMSFAFFSGERAAPLRGAAVSDALLELLAVTVWGELDFLVVDLPPGIGDEVMDVLRFLERPEFLVVSTPSVLSVRVVERLLGLLVELQAPVRGLIENMAIAASGAGSGAPAGPVPVPVGAASAVRELAARRGLAYLGSLPYLPGLEGVVGAPAALRDGAFGQGMRRILAPLVPIPRA